LADPMEYRLRGGAGVVTPISSPTGARDAQSPRR
jgi:hypothetical protein